MKEIEQMSSESTNERKNEMDPTAGSTKGDVRVIICVSRVSHCIVFHLSFSHRFVFHTSWKHLHLRRDVMF